MVAVHPPTLALTPVSGRPDVSVSLPGSKSITNRALLLAGLADGESHLRHPLHSDDTHYMCEALKALGVPVKTDDAGDFIVSGSNGRFSEPSRSPLLIGNSGTTIRFLTAAACLAPAGTAVVLDGNARMRERPIYDLLGALITLGVHAEAVNGHGCPPVRIFGGGMPGGGCRLRGDVSSQYLSAIVQTAPYADNDVRIEIVNELISKPYVDMTIRVMADFGVACRNDNYEWLTVPAGQRYQARDYQIEADASNASYFLAAAAVTGGTVRLTNLGTDSIQGDVAFVDILEQMGCRVERGSNIVVTGPERLRSVNVNMEQIPDMAQTLAIVAAFADGPSEIRGIRSLRVKETDRVRAVATELPKLGVRVRENPESWVIEPPRSGSYAGASISTYDDHRMAMSFAIAGLLIPGVVIKDPGCVAKTFPDFWDRWREAFGNGGQ